jgi:AcrR family transcriptional regulator
MKKVGRPSLTSREAILAAALKLVQQGGEKDLSFRKVAAELNITAPSLYSYFANKQALIAALTAHLFNIDHLPHDTSLPAREQLSLFLDGLRQQLNCDGRLLSLFNNSLPALQMVVIIDAIAEPLMASGFAKAEAIAQGQSLLWMVIGFSLFENDSKQLEVVDNFIEIDGKAASTIDYLDLVQHDRLWAKTLRRNIDGLFGFE